MPAAENTTGRFDLDTVDRLLTTTRAVRKRLDLSREVPLDVVVKCLNIAIQAPTGSNLQLWRWLIITEQSTREKLAQLYWDIPPRPTATVPGPPPGAQQQRMLDSAQYLMAHLAEVPVFVVPCTREVGGAAGWAPSIYPAVWSFILALRSRGLSSVITTAHLYHHQEAAELLGIPEGYAQYLSPTGGLLHRNGFQTGRPRAAGGDLLSQPMGRTAACRGPLR